MVQINLATLPAILIAAGITCVCGILWKMYNKMVEITYMVGTIAPPTGIYEKLADNSGRIGRLERRLEMQEDWLIRKGYDRRDIES